MDKQQLLFHRDGVIRALCDIAKQGLSKFCGMDNPEKLRHTAEYARGRFQVCRGVSVNCKWEMPV